MEKEAFISLSHVFPAGKTRGIRPEPHGRFRSWGQEGVAAEKGGAWKGTP